MTDVIGGFDVSAAGSPITIPCTMLSRDLGALSSATWVARGDGFITTLPKGSVVSVHGASSEGLVERLPSGTPRLLQILTTVCWLRDQGYEHLDVDDIAWGIGAGSTRVIPRSDVRRAVEDLKALDFVAGPASDRSKRPNPGAPIVIAGEGLMLGEAWSAAFSGRNRQTAKLPSAFLAMHAKNDRYAILLAWHLAIMLRVNRKHGYYYRVSLRKLLEGAGIAVPRRNKGRFLQAIVRALAETDGIGSVGPSAQDRSLEALLDGIFAFWLEPGAVAHYAPAAV